MDIEELITPLTWLGQASVAPVGIAVPEVLWWEGGGCA